MCLDDVTIPREDDEESPVAIQEVIEGWLADGYIDGVYGKFRVEFDGLGFRGHRRGDRQSR